MTQKIFSRGSLTSPLFLEYTKDDPSIGNGVLEFSFWASGEDPKQDEHFFKRWNTPNSPHRAFGYYTTYYAILNAIKNAIKNEGQATRETIRDELAKLDVDTPVGHIKFDDHNQAYPRGTVSTIEDSKIKFVEGIDLLPVPH